MSAEKKLIVTSALPYVNNVPHLGNVVGCVLPADVYARYMKNIKKREVLFVGGVDEYGTATEMKARELGISCKELCDQNYDIHKEAYDWFKISFDCYGRTSQPNGDPADPDLTWPHTKITREIYDELVKTEAVIEQEEVVWYCEEIGAYVADRYILSECYHCGHDGADGDQCDQCGNLLSTERLVNPRYKPNPSYSLTRQTTTNLYLNLPEIWKDHRMAEWFESNRGTWSGAADSITSNWVEKKGLKPRSITRDLKWGTRVPQTEKYGDTYSSKVFYVWFDAPIGYLSIMEHQIGREAGLAWWNKDSELVQFMAKDNVPFHSIIFPATLAPLKSDGSYQLPSSVRIAASDYLMYEGQKFSKSKNTGLFCDDVIRISTALDLDPDLFRLYLIYIRPETGDSNFVTNEYGLIDFHNSILINNLGNMCHRIRSILFQYGKKHQKTLTQYDSEIDERSVPDPIGAFHEKVEKLRAAFERQMEDIRLRDALKTLFEVSACCNVLINEVKPWEYTKRERSEIAPLFYEFVMYIYHTIRWIGQNIEPFAPGIGAQILSDFPIGEKDSVITITAPESKPKPIFSPLEQIDVEKYKTN
jgi:methionyl-tRNA synthetase